MFFLKVIKNRETQSETSGFVGVKAFQNLKLNFPGVL